MITKIDENFIVDVPGYEGWASVKILGDGSFYGTLAAHNFEYKGKHYYSKYGNRGIRPLPFTVTIKNGEEIL